MYRSAFILQHFVFFLYINRRAADIEVGVVNMGKSSISRKLVRALNATPELKTVSAYTSSREALQDIDKFNSFCCGMFLGIIPN
jgi:hypothetical protein